MAETGSATGLSMSVVGHVVVGRGDGEVRVADGAAGQAQAVEGLGRGHLVDEVQVDEEQVGLALGLVDDVGVPDLLGQRARRHEPILTISTFNVPPGAWYSTTSPTAVPSSAAPSGADGGGHGQVALALLDGADEELLGVVLVVALVAQRHDAALLTPGREPVSLSTISAVLSMAWSWRIRDSIFPWVSLAAW